MQAAAVHKQEKYPEGLAVLVCLICAQWASSDFMKVLKS